tara:strand:+ start:13454 stop:14239 length:786 start_codon:yes stop_codon:yes gene_type:complete
MPLKHANAMSCVKEYSTLKEIYMRYDVIFSGYVRPSKTKPITEFKITELFKDKIRGSDAKIESLQYFHGGSNYFWGVNLHLVDPETEYIFYGSFPDDNDKWMIGLSPCSKTRLSPEGHIYQLNKWAEDPIQFEEKTGKTIHLIFKGKVVRKEISQKIILKNRHMTRAIADFEIQEIYKNKDTNRETEEIKKITASIVGCEKEYELGEEYIVYAYGAFSLEEPENKWKPNFRSTCGGARGADDWNIKERLRRFARGNRHNKD